MVTTIAWAAIATAVLSSVVIVADLARGGGQKMWIMNVVWPVTALWAGPAGLWAYWRFGRPDSRRAAKTARDSGRDQRSERAQPFPVTVAKATTHCGSGCTLGDLVAELFVAAVPITIAGQRLFGAWAVDFAAAYFFGLAFQYFTIKPMRQLSVAGGIREAIKADTLSLLAWQIGMYGWMALVRFVLFGRELPKSGPVFWFMMQLAMFCGFSTSYPVNWWLVRRGIKERM
jgi:hypothetical protein